LLRSLLFMPEKRLFRDPGSTDAFFEVKDDPTHALVHCSWIGYTGVEQVMQGSALILEFVRKHRRRLLLVDSRLEEGPWNDSNRWILEEWLPEVTAAGLEKTAIIPSDNIFSAMSAREHMETAQERGFDVRVFDSETKARKWLAEENQNRKKK